MAVVSPTHGPLPFPNAEVVTLTILPGKRLERDLNGAIFVYLGGDTVQVPANEAVYLRRDKVAV